MEFVKKLHRWQKFYTAAGSDGIDKFQLWGVKEDKYDKYVSGERAHFDALHAFSH